MKPPRSAKARRCVVKPNRRAVLTLEVETDAPLSSLKDATKYYAYVMARRGEVRVYVLQASANVIKPDTLRARAKRGGRA